MTIYERPIIGVMPEKIHTEQRVLELLTAIINQVQNTGKCKKEWFEEVSKKIVFEPEINLNDLNYFKKNRLL